MPVPAVFPRACRVLAAAAFLALAFFCARGQALASGEATRTLEGAVNQILDDIKNPAYANPATRGPLRKRIEEQVYRVFDFDEFSSRTVGPRWRTFSEREKKRFSEAFAKLLLNTYLNKVNGYNGESVTYTGENSSPDGRLVEVRTAITMKDGGKTPVFYRMLSRDGAWRVYDVIIENISLVKNYRAQFSDILNSASPEQLISRIEAKAREVMARGSAAEGKTSGQ